MLVEYSISYVFFFKQKTAYEMRISDWSSDVCSSDLRVSSRQAFSRSREKVPGGRMRGASEAKHAFDLALPEKRKSSSLRSRPHPALRATFSRFAGEGLEHAFRVTGSDRSALRPPARPPPRARGPVRPRISEEHTTER